MKKLRVTLLLAFIACGACLAEVSDFPLIPSQGPVVIDGKLDEEVWRGKPTISKFYFFAGAKENIPDTRVWISQDDKSLLMAFRCKEPALDKMRLKADEFDGATYSDDSVEIYLVPDRATRHFVQICINAKGVVSDRIGWERFSSWLWDSGTQVKASTDKKGWNLELAIPFANLPLGSQNSTWGINIVRNRRAEAVSTVTSLSTMVFGFSEIDSFDNLTGVAAGQSAVSIISQDFGKGWQGLNKARMVLENKDSAPIKGTARVGMAFKPIGQITPFLLQPGSRVSLELPWECPALKSEALLDIVVEVEGHTPQCVFQGLPPVPDILPKLQRCVFNIIPKEPLIMHNSVCYGFDGGNPQLIWEIWTPDKANKLGEGTTSVASDEPTQRLYWRDFGPGRYCLKRILATDKGVMAEKEENIVLVIEPWR